MKVKMITTAAGPECCHHAGQTVDVSPEQAAEWVVRKHATAIDPVPQKLLDVAKVELQKEIDAANKAAARQSQLERAVNNPVASGAETADKK